MTKFRNLFLWRRQRAKIIAVIDGDTVRVVLINGRQLRVRLAGIDAPETYQRLGPEARNRMRDLCAEPWCCIYPQGQDRHARLVARIEIQGLDLGTEMLRAGLAWRVPNRVKLGKKLAYALAESEARRAQRGVHALLAGQPKPWAGRKIRNSFYPLKRLFKSTGNRKSN